MKPQITFLSMLALFCVSAVPAKRPITYQEAMKEVERLTEENKALLSEVARLKAELAKPQAPADPEEPIKKGMVLSEVEKQLGVKATLVGRRDNGEIEYTLTIFQRNPDPKRSSTGHYYTLTVKGGVIIRYSMIVRES